jgi:uncharacterized OB-fold protein
MTTPWQPREFDAPDTTPETAEFWNAANEGRLLLRHCDACKSAHHFPRTICPHCGSDATRWIESPGRGVVYTLSVMRRGTPVPYAMAYVTLEEGVTMMTNIVECDLDAIRIGDPVQVTFVAARDGRKVPAFKPAPGGAA